MASITLSPYGGEFSSMSCPARCASSLMWLFPVGGQFLLLHTALVGGTSQVSCIAECSTHTRLAPETLVNSESVELQHPRRERDRGKARAQVHAGIQHYAEGRTLASEPKTSFWSHPVTDSLRDLRQVLIPL